MTNKFSIAQKIARLIPPVKKLHDSVLAADSQLEQYKQENDRLRTFIEGETDKLQDLSIAQNGFIEKIETLEFELQKNGDLSEEIKNLKVKFRREQDLNRLHNDLSDEFIVLQEELSAERINSKSLAKKLRKKKLRYTGKIRDLNSALLTETNINVQTSNQKSQLEQELRILKESLDSAQKKSEQQRQLLAEKGALVDAKLNEIDELKKEMGSLSISRKEQVKRSLQLETQLADQTADLEFLSEGLDYAEQQLQNHRQRTLELESDIQVKNNEVTELRESSQRDLAASEIHLKEQIQRTLTLENIIQEKTAEIKVLNLELHDVRESHSQQTQTAIQLDQLTQEQEAKVEQLKEALQQAEASYREQVARSLELESTIQENSKETADSLQQLEQEQEAKVEQLKEALQQAEASYREQVARSLELESAIQENSKETADSLQQLEQEASGTQKMEKEYLELLREVESLNTELKSQEHDLINTKRQLDDSQHYVAIRSEEALARILGKLSQIDYQGSRTPMVSGIVASTNYSAQELVVGKYFSLLIASLTGTLNSDEPISPWSRGVYDEEVRSLGRDWPATACSMIGTVRMTSLQHLVCDVIENNIAGDAIETGVWRGGACILMKSIFDAYGCKDRKVWVADSFEGLPKPTVETYQSDIDDQHYTYDALSVSLQEVKDNFEKFGVLDSNVKFLQGWFKDTLHKAPIDKLAILRLDGDMEESTIQALDALYHKVSKGGYVIVDDYGLGPCRDAVDNFRKEHKIQDPLIDVDGACVYWKVQ